MLESLRRLFTVNIGFKITALLIALGITHMKYEDNSSTVTAELTVSPILPKDQVLMTQPVERVTVTIEGKYTDLRKIDTKSLGNLEPNLTGIHGQFNFQANGIKLPAGLRVTKIEPPMMWVIFEPLKTRDVPIEATFVGEPISGYRLINDSVTPASLTVSGAASVVDAMQHVQTERITLVGRKESSKFNVQLAAPPEFVTYVNPAPSYEVTIDIEEIRGTRALTDRPIEIRLEGEDEDADDYETFPETVYVTLAGPMRQLETVQRDLVRPYIDLSSQAAKRQAMRKKGVRVAVDVPAGLTVTEIKPDAVRVFRREPKEKADEGQDANVKDARTETPGVDSQENAPEPDASAPQPRLEHEHPHRRAVPKSPEPDAGEP